MSETETHQNNTVPLLWPNDFHLKRERKGYKCLAAYESRQITNYNVELFIHRKMYVTSHMQVITL